MSLFLLYPSFLFRPFYPSFVSSRRCSGYRRCKNCSQNFSMAKHCPKKSIQTKVTPLHCSLRVTLVAVLYMTPLHCSLYVPSTPYTTKPHLGDPPRHFSLYDPLHHDPLSILMNTYPLIISYHIHSPLVSLNVGTFTCFLGS